MIKKGLNPRLAEVGKIKIGGKGDIRKSAAGKDYQIPIKFEHFIVTTTEKGGDGNFIINHDIMKLLGKEPKEIPIRLLFDDIDMNFFTSFQSYQGAKLFCMGNGETAERENQKINCDPENCSVFKENKCKVSGILSCLLSSNMEIGGVYKFRTHSWNSVSNILAALRYFSENTNGILAGLPLKLKFIKKSTQEHGNVNVVTLVLDGIELIKMREIALSEYKNRMELGIDMKLIEGRATESGLLDDKDDPEDIEAEFYRIMPEQKAPEKVSDRITNLIPVTEVKKEDVKVENSEPEKETKKTGKLFGEK
jgi:hypothetical protein